MRILVTNDDGLQAEGLNRLAEALGTVAETFVVAPAGERSGAGHSITLSKPVRAEEVRPGWVAVDGTPVDCVILAANELMPQKPDILISGINHGPNMGEDIFYSGTVAAAIEGSLTGIPSLAVSIAGKSHLHFEAACAFIVDLVDFIGQSGLAPGALLNINVPNLPRESVSGCSLTRLGQRSYTDIITKKQDPRGRTYYWIAGQGPNWTGDEQTDFNAVSRGLISITPIHLDLTDHHEMDGLRQQTLSKNFPLIT
ncbi:5'/3'-nucleotidase SurE [candidate division KSB1 bacterium]